LGGQSDPLGFSAGKGGSGAVQVQVVEAHVGKKVEALFDFGANVPNDSGVAAGKTELGKEIPELPDRHGVDRGHRLAGKTHGPCHRIKPGPLAGGAGQELVLLELFPRQFQLLLFLRLILGLGFGRFGENRAVPLALRTPTVGAVERKQTRVQFIKGAVGSWAEEMMAVDSGFPVVIDRIEDALAQGEGLGDEGGKVLLAGVYLGDQDFDLVFPIAVERLEFGGFDPFAVDPEQGESFFLGPSGDLGVEAFATTNERGQQAKVFGGAELGADAFDDVGRGLADGWLAGIWIVLDTQLGVEQAKELIKFGDRGDGGFPASASGALLNRHGRREAGDGVDVRLFHLLHKLAGVGVETVEIAALALREEQVKGESGFAGAREAGNHDHFVPGDGDIEVLEVVVTSASHGDFRSRAVPVAGLRRQFLKRSGATRAQKRGEESGGVGAAGRGDRFRGAGSDQLSAVLAGFGAEIEDPVGIFDDVQVVLDHQQGISLFDQTMKQGNQQSDVLQMKTGGRFIQDE